MVGTKGLGAISTRVVQPHQLPIGLLPQRVDAQQPLGVRDRLGKLTGRLAQSRRFGESVEVPAPQPLAISKQPIVGQSSIRSPV